MTKLPALLALSLIFGGCAVDAGTYDPATCEEGNDPGDCSQDFTLPDGDQLEWTLSEHLGKVVVVQFGQMWCTQCRRAAVDMGEITGEEDPDTFQVFAVYFEDGSGESVETDEVAAYVEEYELDAFPVLADEDGSVEAVWGYNNGRPNVFVVDAEGIVRFRTSGHRDGFADDMRAAISDARQPVE